MDLDINNVMVSLVEIFSFFMLIMGLMLSLTRAVHRMIPYYQFQCIGLAVITFLTAIELRENIGASISVGVFVVIPILLAIFIEPLLAQATVSENIPVRQRLLRLFDWSIRPHARQQAMLAWLHIRRSRRGTLAILTIDLVLLTLAFITAFTLAGTSSLVSPATAFLKVSSAGSGLSPINIMALAVAFSLLLLGLSTMINSEDIISQVIGLLVMEQGMFLAAVRLLPSSTMRIFFIAGLFLYIIITLTILVFLLPELHYTSGSLDIDQQTRLKG